MARLDRTSLLRWPRRIMVSIVSLGNRLATALSPSSPVRSRHSQAIWKDSLSNWESEIVMAGKRSGAAGVPSPRPIDEPWRTTLHLPAWWNLTVASIGRRCGPRRKAAEFVEPNAAPSYCNRGNVNGPGQEAQNGARRIRLLILGAQVLFGFLFQAVFQDLFKE